MKNWIIYTKERFPLPVFLVLCGGLTFSAIFIFKSPFSWLSFVVSYAGLLLFFFELRLMDELKDYDKDIIAHPERPLPRGLISREDARKAVIFILLAMFFCAVLSGVLLNLPSGISYIIITIYLWLMYKEFFVGKWLDESPLLYAISHQIIIFPLCIFSIVIIHPDKYFHPDSFFLGLAILGSFFSYEICRKLDPAANMVLKTYLTVYGPLKTSSIVIVSTGLSAIGAAGLNLSHLLWPAESILLSSLVVMHVKPNKYRIVEGVAAVSLVVHLWAVVLCYFSG